MADGKKNMATIGVDLGGSHVAAMLVERDGTIRSRVEYVVENTRFKAVSELIIAAIKEMLGKAKAVDAVGVGSPGNIDPLTGTVRYSPNFGWRDEPLGKTLNDALGMPVHIGNDARCATLGEYTYGSGKGISDFVLLTLGTGIGGGIVSSGRLILGGGMAAGEVGHHQIRATDGFICGCGKIGCFEAQASGTGLLRHAMAIAPSFPRSTLLGSKPYEVGSKAIRKAAEAGDMHALSAWNRFIDDLSVGLANIIAYVNPELIALGGGVSSAGAFLLDAVAPLVEQRTTMAPRGMTRIATAKLGNDAGGIGAAVMARRGGLRACGELGAEPAEERVPA